MKPALSHELALLVNQYPLLLGEREQLAHVVGTASTAADLSQPAKALVAKIASRPPLQQTASRTSLIRAIVSAEFRSLLTDVDDDPIGELDDDTLILLQAMAELDEESGVEGRAWNPALHLRWPKGHPKAGTFRPMVDQLKSAILAFDPSKDTHPFQHFKRPQLLNAAKARGITVKRGESDDSLRAKLLADLGGKPVVAKPAAGPNATPAKPTPSGVTTKPGAKWPTGDATTEVHLGGDQLGLVVHSSKIGGFFPFIPGGSKKTPLGNTVRVQPGSGSGYQTEQSAVDAIVRAHTPAKVSGPGLAGLKLTELRIEAAVGGWNGTTRAKASHEIYESGTPIGTVSEWGGYFTADLPGGGGSAQGPHGHTMKTKSEAIQALVAAMPNPPAQGGTAMPAPVALPQGGKHAPEIQGTLDILYGKDPKGHTMARQLSVYGSLRRDQFQQLGPAEQSTVLGDLAFIAATSKGKSAASAVNLVHRFTPPGTTTGMIHKQAVHVPSGVAAAQTRVADPNGTPGLLKVRDPKDRGTSGDGWTRLPNGGTGPWGKYGAAGVMLRHVDPADGTERFLMVQRGPGISDPGKWQFPGGAIDSKETPHEGAARETVEELGLKEKDMLDARVHGTHEASIPGSAWKYTSIVATVDKQLKPDLSTHHARMETADAKWMTRADIDALDSSGKLLKPLAGGQLQTNVMSLFPSKAAPAAPSPAVPGKRPPRLTGTPTVSAPTLVTHKASLGKDLFPDKASKDALRQQIKQDRKKFAGKSADDRLAAIGAMQGFDDVPTVVSKSEMDRLLKTGAYVEAWRGVKGMGSGYRAPTRGGAVSNSKTAAQINEEFRSGPAYYGNGIFGNGYYFATEKQVAEGYGDRTKGSLIRVLIPKKAKIVHYVDALNGARSAASPRSKAKGKSHEDGTLYNEGRYAAAKGFDVIEISSNVGSASHVARRGKPAYNILNRSVLIVEEA